MNPRAFSSNQAQRPNSGLARQMSLQTNASLRSLPTYHSNPTSPPSYISDAAASSQELHAQVHTRSAGFPGVNDQQDQFDMGITMTGIAGDPESFAKPIYLYYRLYNQDGAIPSKQPVVPRYHYVGCIDANLISPPHTVSSITRCICKIEEIADHNYLELFSSASSTTPMNNNEHLEILTGESPGSTPGKPYALVQMEMDRQGLGPFPMSLSPSPGHGRGRPLAIEYSQERVLRR